jgi:hypothetical protein
MGQCAHLFHIKLLYGDIVPTNEATVYTAKGQLDVPQI